MNTTEQQVENCYNGINTALFRIDSEFSFVDVMHQTIYLCKLINQLDETESIWSIGEFTEASLDDYLVGAYWFFCDYHKGQNSLEYETQCAISSIFNPGCTSGPEPDTSEECVYNTLESLLQAEQ